jgi:asparagine synthase (glutamine-hydrolysing)
MCGIAGFFHIVRPREELEKDLRAMADALRHRGPDDFGTFLSPDSKVGFVHTRLSILDLSPSGHQPMMSHSGRSWITFNGEIYNFADIRAELQKDGFNFRTGTDTEMLVNAIEHWGIDRTLSKCIGMFAFAVWDQRDHTVLLARDRLGKKPLYVGELDGGVIFGSELRALTAVRGFNPAIDRSSLSAYLKYNYVPTPYSIYQGVRKVEPGTYLKYRVQDAVSCHKTTFWSVPGVVEQTSLERSSGFTSETEALQRLEDLLTDSIRLRLIADVEVGCFLSGGIDSSLVSALVAKRLGRRIKSFTIGYTEPSYDESSFAKAVAQHLGTEHIEMILSARDVQSAIPQVLSAYDEPFADSSQLPTYLVSKLARQHVTVTLSGDAGDELFGGYNRHVWATKIFGWSKRVPGPLRRLIGRRLKASDAGKIEAIFGLVNQFLPATARQNNMGYKLQKVGRVLDSRSLSEVYEFLVAYRRDPAPMLIDRATPHSFYGHETRLEGLSEAEQMMALDSMSYLLDDILTKVDRASMACSLEARVPFLDHRVVEQAWTLPCSFKIKGQVGKYPLRKILAKYVPQQLFERPKAGFGVPIDFWLKSDLRDWAMDLIGSQAVSDLGLDRHQLNLEWKVFVEGREKNYERIWNALSLIHWAETYRH